MSLNYHKHPDPSKSLSNTYMSPDGLALNVPSSAPSNSCFFGGLDPKLGNVQPPYFT